MRDGDRFRTLPAPPRPEQLRTSHDVEPENVDLDDDYRELQWLLRVGGF